MAQKLYAIDTGLTLGISNVSGNIEGVLKGISRGGQSFTLPLNQESLRRLRDALADWLGKKEE